MQIKTRYFCSKETFEKFLSEQKSTVLWSSLYYLQPEATIYFSDKHRTNVIASHQGENYIIYGTENEKARETLGDGG